MEGAGGDEREAAQDHRFLMQHGVEAFRDLHRRNSLSQGAGVPQTVPARLAQPAAPVGAAADGAEEGEGEGEDSASQPLLSKATPSVEPEKAGAPEPGKVGGDGGEGEAMSRDFFKLLATAPQGVLIHLLMQYHDELIAAGRHKEADDMAASLARLVLPRVQHLSTEELHGTDLLLQQGLLNFMLAINPFLPVPQAQVVKFKDISLSIKRAVPQGFEDLGKKASKAPFLLPLSFHLAYPLLGLWQLGGMAQGPLAKKPPVVDVEVLSGVSGYIMPGTSTLVLGPPGCGKSTLMKILSGRLDAPTMTGEVLFNGRPLAEVLPRRLAGVAEAEDHHMPFITVRETLEFARNCSQVWTFKNYGPELQEFFEEALRLGQDPKIEMVLSMMGLKRVAARPAGSALIPTTTADERRRLTAAELMSGIYTVFLLDEVNTGVDPAQTYNLLEQLLIYTRVRQMGVMISVEHPAPEVFRLFDRVLLLSRGKTLFHGHRLDALPYFQQLGYVKPQNVETAEFLLEIATEDALGYLTDTSQSMTVDQLAAAFEGSAIHRDNMRVIDSPEVNQEVFVQASKPLGIKIVDGPRVGEVPEHSQLGKVGPQQSAPVLEGDAVVALATPSEPLLQAVAPGTEASEVQRLLDEGGKEAREKGGSLRVQLERPYQVPESASARNFAQEYLRKPFPEIRELTWRAFISQWRNKFGVYARLFQIVLLSLFTGTFFFQMPSSPITLDLNLRRGVVFISLMNLTLINLAQMPQHFDDRLVLYKHTAARFHRPSSYWAASFLGAAPFSLVEATIWSVIVYFVSGMSYADEGGHFFIFWGIMILVALQVMLVAQGSAMVRAIGYLMPDRDAAGAISGVLIAMLVLFAGFVCPRALIPGWWIWVYYINPLAWGVTALLINEFSSSEYSYPCSSLSRVQLALYPPCARYPTSTVGEAFLQAGTFLYEPYYIAVGAAAITGWIIIWNALAFLAMARVRHLPPIDEGLLPRGEIEKREESSMFLMLTGGKSFSQLAHAVGRGSHKEPGQQAAAGAAPGPGPGGDSEKGAGGSAPGAAEGKSLEGKARLALCGAELKIVPITMTWHQLGYEMRDPHGNKSQWIFKGVSGWGKPGEMVAIVGASRTGKTTLLNSLAGRYVSPDCVVGQILVNGAPKEQATFSRVLGYVDRTEAYSPFMTVRESLQFSAALRLGSAFTRKQREGYVDEVIELMGLGPFQQRLVASLRGRMTKEQGKRVAVAVEVAGNPGVIFLDDPMINLEGPSALRLMRCVQQVAAQGRLVVVSTRHLTIRLGALFDSLLLLKTGGQCVYFGPIGPQGLDLQKYFESIPGVPPCPPGTNPCSFAMNSIGDGVGERVAVRDFEFEYQVSALALANATKLEELRAAGARGELGPELRERGFAASYWLQLREVNLRVQRQYWRNLHYSFGRLMSSIVLGLLIGSLFWQTDVSTAAGMNARGGQIFASCLLLMVGNAQNVVPQVVAALPVFKRERATRQYKTSAVSIAWGLAEILYLAVASLVFCAISCTMSGTATASAGQFFQYWFIVYELVLAITFLGMLIAVAVPFPPAAAVLVSMLISLAIPTSGLVLVRDRYVQPYIWLYWLNPLQYALNALTSLVFYCDVNSPQCINGGLNPGCATNPAACPDCTCLRLTDARNVFAWPVIEEARRLDYSNISLFMGVLALYCLLFRTLAFLAIFRLKHNRRT